MKRWVVGFAVAVVVLCGVGRVQAVIVTWNFAGTMDDGGAFSGFVSFDTDVPNDLTPNPHRSLYTNAITDLRVNIGGAEVFLKVPLWNSIDVMNDQDFPDPNGDLIRLYAEANSFEIANVSYVDLFFVDATGALLENTQIPMTPPDLSLLMLSPTLNDWGDHYDLSSPAVFRLSKWTSEAGVWSEDGTITSLSIIPEPTTFIIWSLLGALALTVGWWRRRRAA